MRKGLILGFALAVCGLAAVPAHSTFAAGHHGGGGGGNSGAAHMCQKGGYRNVVGTDGTTDVTFKNAGQCVAYVAHGGSLVSASSASPCLNGGYASLVPAGSNTPFTSEAQCVQYVGQGGTVYPVGVLTVTPTPAQNSAEVAQLSGSGLQAGSTPTYSASYSDQSSGSGSMTNAVGSDGSYTDTFTVQCAQAPAQVTFTATTASGATVQAQATLPC